MASAFTRPGDDDADTILAVRSSMPGGVGGDADDAGDVGEYVGDGVSGVVGGVIYATVGFGGGSTGLGGEGYRCPYDGDGLACDGAAKGLAVGGGVDFFVDGRIYVGYGPGPTKSLRIMSSNSLSVTGSTLSSHSRYWHISLSIWLISRSWNIP